MRGNEIVVSAGAGSPRGVFMEGIVKTGETFYPGMIVQRDASVALQGGRATYKIYAPGTDGEQPVGAFWVVVHGFPQNQAIAYNTSYAAGSRVQLYSPIAGEELNLLLLNISGTGDDHALNEKLVVDTGTGKLIATTGSPETEVAVLLETVTDPTTDTLAWCEWTGH